MDDTGIQSLVIAFRTCSFKILSIKPHSPSEHTDVEETPLKQTLHPSALFHLHLFTCTFVQNPDRTAAYWNHLIDHTFELLKYGSDDDLLVRTVTVCALKLLDISSKKVIASGFC